MVYLQSINCIMSQIDDLLHHLAQSASADDAEGEPQGQAPEVSVAPQAQLRPPAPATSARPTGSTAPRDVPIQPNEVKQFIDGKKKKSTIQATSRDINNIRRWLVEQHMELRPLEQIPPAELDGYLSMFLISVRKASGEDYEPSSLTNMVYSFDRHLTSAHYSDDTGAPLSLLKDVQFRGTRESLKAKRIDLKQKGKGARPHKSQSISREEEELFWDRGVFGTSNPENLQFTLWYFMTLCFGLRGRDEQRKMAFGDIKLHKDRDGKELLQLTERDSKTRDGAASDDARETPQRYFCICDPQIPDTESRCLIEIWKIFINRRSKKTLEPDSPLFLSKKTPQQLQASSVNSDVWYRAEPMGVNTLAQLLPNACKKAGIESRGNHGVRATCVQRLREANIPDDKIVQVTGHKSTRSLSSYDNKELRPQEHDRCLKIVQNLPTESMQLLPYTVPQPSTPLPRTVSTQQSAGGQMAALQPAQISVPQPAQMSLPQPAQMSLPQPAQMFLPQPAQMSLPQPAQMAALQPVTQSLCPTLSQSHTVASSSSSWDRMVSVSGSTFTNCQVTFKVNQAPSSSCASPPKKFRRIVPLVSSSESESSQSQ